MAKLQFGKYAGHDIENVPLDYLQWLKAQAEDRIKEADTELQRRAALEQPITPWADRIVGAGFKTLAQTHHPDKGGMAADFQALKTAYEQLKAVLREMRAAVGGAA